MPFNRLENEVAIVVGA
nr:limonoate dehydrogenase {N-terminal} [Arthrobacter globiformis, Peptide Partial, 16 aa] [Arthrobacter globiformis]